MAEGRILGGVWGDRDGKDPIFPNFCLIVITFDILLGPVREVEHFLNIEMYFIPNDFQWRGISIEDYDVSLFLEFPKDEVRGQFPYAIND